MRVRVFPLVAVALASALELTAPPLPAQTAAADETVPRASTRRCTGA